jgi:hypothetical protein
VGGLRYRFAGQEGHYRVVGGLEEWHLAVGGPKGQYLVGEQEKQSNVVGDRRGGTY